MSDSDPWQPPVPPPFRLEDRQIVTRFEGWVVGHTSTTKGYDKFTIGVPKPDVFKAMLMMQQPLKLYFEVHGPIPTAAGQIDADLALILGIELDVDLDGGDEMDWNQFDGD